MSDASKAADVLSVAANPNISDEDKLAYAMLTLSEELTGKIKDPTGGFFSSGWSTGHKIIRIYMLAKMGEGPLSNISDDQMGYYVQSVIAGRQCTNAGKVETMGNLTKGMKGTGIAIQAYSDLAKGYTPQQILQKYSPKRRSKMLALSNTEALPEGAENASFVVMTGRMAAEDNSYVNKEATTFSIYVNGNYLGDVENNGLTEMFSVGLLTDVFQEGQNKIIRDYNTNPGSHFVTADTELSYLVDPLSEVGFIGEPGDYADLRALPDFAVYPENISVTNADGKTGEAILGEPCEVQANLYNRGQRSGWVDAVVTCGEEELYRVENQYIGPFADQTIRFTWTPESESSEIRLTLTNKTVGVEERSESNNTAALSVTARERVVPQISKILPEQIVLENEDKTVYFTALVQQYSDVKSVTFSLDGEFISGDVSSTTYNDSRQYAVPVKLSALTIGEHSLHVDAVYDDGTGSKTASETITLLVREHDCDLDGHSLIYHAEVPATTEAAGTREYWYCKYCGKLFADANGTEEIGMEDILIDKPAFDASIVSRSAEAAQIRIRIPEGIAAGQILISCYEDSQRFAGLQVCTAAELAQAKTAGGVTVSVANAAVFRVLVLNSEYRPVCPGVELR